MHSVCRQMLLEALRDRRELAWLYENSQLGVQSLLDRLNYGFSIPSGELTERLLEVTRISRARRANEGCIRELRVFLSE